MRESGKAREVGNGESHSHPYHVDILGRNLHVLLECVWLPLHVHLGKE